uniref:Uncharacterized protein n=1 Tax=Theropithecus gelada TaxID=9565 RepID=A0A8D2EZA3_THEGE
MGFPVSPASPDPLNRGLFPARRAPCLCPQQKVGWLLPHPLPSPDPGQSHLGPQKEGQEAGVVLEPEGWLRLGLSSGLHCWIPGAGTAPQPG